MTFTYGGVKISSNASIMDKAGSPMPGLFACGERLAGCFGAAIPEVLVLLLVQYLAE
ncbi:FAD-binding protein [Rhodobacteraceae bacterium nBUS_24]